jgi:hypothetical protein
VNPAALPALFAQHKMAVLGAGAAGAVLLGLRARRKSTTGAGGAVTSRPAGTLPAAAVVPANGLQANGPDNTAVQVYDALQSELAPFLQQQAAQTDASSAGVAAAVAPVASTLFAPNLTGKYVRYNQGTIGEIESDGSIYGISGPELTDAQWADVRNAGISSLGTAPFDTTGPLYGDRATNLTAIGTAARTATKTT